MTAGQDATEDVYRVLFASMGSSVCVIRLFFNADQQPFDYLFEQVNPAFERRAGLGDVVGRRISELVPDLEQFWFDLYGRVAVTGQAERCELETGDTWVDVQVFPLGAPGQPRVAVLFNDVGERKRTERALHQSEQRFRALATAGSFTTYRMSPDWSHIYELNGTEFVAPTGAPIAHWTETYIPESDRPVVRAAIADAVRSRTTLEVEHRVVRADGSVGWARSRAVPILGDEGEIVEWYGAATEVTEQRAASERLRRNEERLRLILASARDYAIFTTDPTGRIDSWYAGAENVFGWSADDAVGQPVEITYTPEDQAAGVPEMERATALESGYAASVRWQAGRDGGRVFVEGFAVPLKSSTGELTGFLKIGQDVTERHRAQERQSTLLAELQHRVRNILAVIRSIISRTREEGQSAEEFVQHLQGRIGALARTQVLLTRAVDAGVDLDILIRDELAAHPTSNARVGLEGPQVKVPPKAAEVLTLAIHELATNSAKYGALSHDNAHLAIEWKTEARGGERWVALSWVESGVEVKFARPLRRGFGTELITRRVPYELRGTGSLDLHPEGVSCHIAFPLAPAPSILQTGGVGS